MKNTSKQKKWFSIVLAMWITIVISLIAILILEFIIPFSRNIKWVENGTVAYYWAYSGIEEGMWELSQNNIWFDTSSLFIPTASTGTQYSVQSTTSIIPPAWDGNSEYDSDWNRFDPNIPIQLSLSDIWWTKIIGVDFDNVIFTFRVPDMNSNGDITDDGNLPINNEPIINWILSWIDSWDNPVVLNGKDDSWNANYIRKNQINWLNVSLWSLNGITLDGNDCTVTNFYEDTCPSSWSWITTQPTLKLSIIDTLELTTGKKIPYLEYKIDFLVDVPGRYTQIITDWKSYGYKKSMDIKVPQQSTNQAFDFAVFQ